MCHYHGYQGRRVAIGLESPKHGWLLHQGAAATTIDLAMSANPSVASQSGPDLSTISSVARLAFLKLDARISANSPYQTNPSANRARLTASLLRTDHLDRHVVRRLSRSQRTLHLPRPYPPPHRTDPSMAMLFLRRRQRQAQASR